MPRILLLFLVAFALALGGMACGGDDNKDESPTASARPTTGPTPSLAATPSEGDKTPGPGETEGPSPAPAPSPLTGTPASRGTPAKLIEDPTSFFQQNYPGVSPVQQDCQYNIAEVIVNCEGTEYAPDPPFVSPGTECFALLVNSERVALLCSSQEPLTTAYYDIQ